MKNYKDKKYALILGRAVAGCGETFCAVQMQKWCEKNGIDLEVFGYADKKMSRSGSHDLTYTAYKGSELDKLQETLSQKDVVMYFTYPYAKASHEYAIEFYEKIVRDLQGPKKIGFIHEIHKAQIDKIPHLIPIMNAMDLIYGYGSTTWFNRVMNEMFPSKIAEGRVKRIPLWFDLDDQRKFRNEDVNKTTKIMYIGRWTSTKEPHRLLHLAPYLKEVDNNFEIVLKGIERSIGAKFDIYDNPYAIAVAKTKNGWVEKANEKGIARVYDAYQHDETMVEMSNSMFGCSFFHLDKHPEEYGDRMEYTMMEIINCGAIPVFDIHWAKNNLMLSQGITYYEYNLKHPFVVLSDREKLQETADEIKELINNPEKRAEMIKNGYEVLKLEFDADVLCPKMLDEMLNVVPDTNKFASEEDIIRHMIDDKYVNEYLSLYNEYKAQGVIPVWGYRELYEGNVFAIIDGKKERVIKDFKEPKRRRKIED